MGTGQNDGPLNAPGAVNGHTHIYSGLVPLGMPQPEPEPANFVEILERVWWRLDRALDEECLRASAEFYIAESLGAGTTVLIDHHESPNFIEGSLDVLRDAATQLRMHALLCYGVTERNGGPDEARRGLAENRRFLESAPDPLVRGGVGLHASFTVSDDTIRAAAELAHEFKAPLHIHVAEDLADVRDARQRGYRGVIDRLDQLGALQPGSILAHGVHLTRDEVAMASERGCWFVQNPRSNRANNVGYPAHLGAAKRVALGTDGFPSTMGTETEALMEEAKRAEARGAEGEFASARRRPGASLALALELFPDLIQRPPAPKLPPAERLATIRCNAALQAKRLWARMATL